MFDAEDFIADLTLHIPPKNVQYIRRYGLYASRTRGIWISMPEVIARAPQGWKNEHLNNVGIEAEGEQEDHDISLSEKERLIEWARLLAKVYEVHPFTCPKCQSDMSIIAVIMDPGEINKILQHLVKDFLPITKEEKIITHADNLVFGTREGSFDEIIEMYRQQLGDSAVKKIKKLKQDVDRL